eukprot:1195377-Prorocentrum_minimum.AAC.1
MVVLRFCLWGGAGGDAAQDSEENKAQGNALYKRGDYRLAKAKYHKVRARAYASSGIPILIPAKHICFVIIYHWRASVVAGATWPLRPTRVACQVACQIDGCRGLHPDQFETLEQIKVSCHLNFAQCCLKQGEHHEAARRLTEKVLRHNPDNPKALYRCAADIVLIKCSSSMPQLGKVTPPNIESVVFPRLSGFGPPGNPEDRNLEPHVIHYAFLLSTCIQLPSTSLLLSTSFFFSTCVQPPGRPGPPLSPPVVSPTTYANRPITHACASSPSPHSHWDGVNVVK